MHFFMSVTALLYNHPTIVRSGPDCFPLVSSENLDVNHLVLKERERSIAKYNEGKGRMSVFLLPGRNPFLKYILGKKNIYSLKEKINLQILRGIGKKEILKQKKAEWRNSVLSLTWQKPISLPFIASH